MSNNLEHAVNKMRRQAVLQILYDCYPTPKGESLIVNALQDRKDLQLTRERVKKIFAYLEDKGLIDVLDNGNFHLAALRPDGIDAAEHHKTFDSDRLHHNRMLRLRVLSALDALRPTYLGEQLILVYLRSDGDLDLSPPNIARALRYLADRDLVELSEDGFLARIRSTGVDYLEGAGDDLPGVARPARL